MSIVKALQHYKDAELQGYTLRQKYIIEKSLRKLRKSTPTIRKDFYNVFDKRKNYHIELPDENKVPHILQSMPISGGRFFFKKSSVRKTKKKRSIKSANRSIRRNRRKGRKSLKKASRRH